MGGKVTLFESNNEYSMAVDVLHCLITSTIIVYPLCPSLRILLSSNNLHSSKHKAYPQCLSNELLEMHLSTLPQPTHHSFHQPISHNTPS